MKLRRQTAIGTYLRCPRQYLYAWEERIKRPPGVALPKGSAFHHGAEQNWGHKMEKGEDLAVPALQDIAATRFSEILDETNGEILVFGEDPMKVKGKALDELMGTMVTFGSFVAPPIQPETVEKNIKMVIDEHDIEMTCTLDLITVGKDLIDFKSGRTTNQAASDASRQLTWYTAAYIAEFSEAPSSLGLWKVNEKKSEWFPTSRTDFDIQQLYQTVIEVDKAIVAGSFPPCNTEGWNCHPKWCGFHWQTGGPCKYGRRIQ